MQCACLIKHQACAVLRGKQRRMRVTACRAVCGVMCGRCPHAVMPGWCTRRRAASSIKLRAAASYKRTCNTQSRQQRAAWCRISTPTRLLMLLLQRKLKKLRARASWGARKRMGTAQTYKTKNRQAGSVALKNRTLPSGHGQQPITATTTTCTKTSSKPVAPIRKKPLQGQLACVRCHVTRRGSWRAVSIKAAFMYRARARSRSRAFCWRRATPCLSPGAAAAPSGCCVRMMRRRKQQRRRQGVKRGCGRRCCCACWLLDARARAGGRCRAGRPFWQATAPGNAAHGGVDTHSGGRSASMAVATTSALPQPMMIGAAAKQKLTQRPGMLRQQT